MTRTVQAKPDNYYTIVNDKAEYLYFDLGERCFDKKAPRRSAMVGSIGQARTLLAKATTNYKETHIKQCLTRIKWWEKDAAQGKDVAESKHIIKIIKKDIARTKRLRKVDMKLKIIHVAHKIVK